MVRSMRVHVSSCVSCDVVFHHLPGSKIVDNSNNTENPLKFKKTKYHIAKASSVLSQYRLRERDERNPINSLTQESWVNKIDEVGRHGSVYFSAKPKGCIYLLVKYADTAFWFCTALYTSHVPDILFTFHKKTHPQKYLVNNKIGNKRGMSVTKYSMCSSEVHCHQTMLLQHSDTLPAGEQIAKKLCAFCVPAMLRFWALVLMLYVCSYNAEILFYKPKGFFQFEIIIQLCLR